MELTETYFHTGEVQLHVMVGPPNGPPLLLIHGATGSWKSWQPLLPFLLHHWQVFLPDLRGHGLSDRSPNGMEGYHISAFIRDTIALLDEMIVEPAVLFGHSWGALISLLTPRSMDRTALNCLRALVAEDPPVISFWNPPDGTSNQDNFGWALDIKRDATSYDTMLAALRHIVATFPDPVPESEMHEWTERLLQVDPDFLRMVNHTEAVDGVDFDHEFEKIGCPLLMLQADPAIAGCFLDTDIALIQAQVPTAQNVFFPGVGHAIHKERPEDVAKVFEEFIMGLKI
jgi:pimeloyl-ACP methyl ester carboxylesterase